jgi:hypothetical protein
MNPRFRVTVGSEPEYEDLVGDIYFDDSIVCVLTQESGFDQMEIEFFPPKEGGTWVFKLAEFEEALAFLKKRMWELRRSSADGSKT